MASAARHAAGAGRFDDFVTLARDGAQHYLRQGSTFQSLRLADEALREAPEDPTLLAVAAESAWLISLYEEAISYTDRWVDVARVTGDPEEEASALRWRLRLHHDMGHPERVELDRDRLADLIGVLPPGGRRARAMAAMAQSHMLQDHRDLAVEWADRAIAAAQEIGDLSVLAQARIERGSALNAGQDGDDRELRAAIDEAEALGEWVLVTRGLNNQFEAVPVFTPEGRALVERFRRAAGRAGFDSMSHAIAAFREGEIAFGDGDLRAARRAKERGEEWWLRCGQEADWLSVLEFDLAFEEGRAGDARIAIDRLELSKHHGNASWRARTELQLAWLQDDADAVRWWFGEYVTSELPSNLYFLPDVLVVVDLALDGGVEAPTVRTGIEAALDGHPSVERVSFVLDGLLWAAEGASAQAAERLDVVLADPDPTLPGAVLGHLRTRRAQALLAMGDRSGARDELHRALDVELARWPGWRRDRAAALLARVEGGVPAPEGELTAREREVAALLSEGLTNGELGRRLYISPKTVAVHVSNILTKLHLSNRAEIAAWAVRSGVVQDT
jgi:DNA-binding CsgD family transcriptional regulator